MPEKHAAADRVGGPGASHKNRQHPEKTSKQAELKQTDARSDVSGGGGENDAHHTHDPALKGKGRS
jgi:hypothetical protein